MVVLDRIRQGKEGRRYTKVWRNPIHKKSLLFRIRRQSVDKSVALEIENNDSNISKDIDCKV
jgi:hypothetical protein